LAQLSWGKVVNMKKALDFFLRSVLGGFLFVVPVYLAVLLLLKGMKSVTGVVRPLAKLVPESLPAETLLSLLVVLVVCFLIGAAFRTPIGSSLRERTEKALFERIPGYALLRSLTQQIAGSSDDKVWKPALFELEECLVPAFIIEEFEDGRYTIFVPSIPTPFAGAVYIADRARVHPLDVPFTAALRTVSRWGAGSRDLLAGMEGEGKPRADAAAG
jgi:uncharacterized membrane protein